MHKSFGWLTLFLAAAGSASARDAVSDQRELLKADAAVCSAFESGDAKALGDILDATFTLTSSRGEVTDRAQNLEEVAKREPYYDVFRNHDQRVRLYGDAAIITGITTVKGRSEGDAFAVDFQFTDTWVHRDGHWILAASHASKLADK